MTAKGVGYLAIAGFGSFFFRVSLPVLPHLSDAIVAPQPPYATADGQNEPMLSEFARRPFWYFHILSRWGVSLSRLLCQPSILPRVMLSREHIMRWIRADRKIEYVQHRRLKTAKKAYARKKRSEARKEKKDRKAQKARTNGLV